MQLARNHLYAVLEPAREGHVLSKAVDLFIIALILMNVVVMVLETVPSVNLYYARLFHLFDLVSLAIFSVEYILRVLTAVENPRYAEPIRGRLRYMRTPMAVIDLMAILPFFLPMIGLDLRFMRAARLFRIFRMLKLARYSSAMRVLGEVFRRRREELMVTVGIVALVLLFSSSLIYFAEHQHQPNGFGSIPEAMWWGVATLTTVGYGDVTPITPMGKFLAAVIQLTGIGMFALPTGIIGAGFVEEMQRHRKTNWQCPHCGGEIERRLLD